MLGSHPLGMLVTHLPLLIAAKGAIFSLTLLGITLFIDRAEEMTYLDVAPDHSPEALPAFEQLAGLLGYELMPETECLSQELANGSIRTWLVELDFDMALPVVA